MELCISRKIERRFEAYDYAFRGATETDVFVTLLWLLSSYFSILYGG